MLSIRYLLRTRYRTIQIGDEYFPQSRYWWWPFWLYFETEINEYPVRVCYATLDDSEFFLRNEFERKMAEKNPPPKETKTKHPFNADY